MTSTSALRRRVCRAVARTPRTRPGATAAAWCAAFLRADHDENRALSGA